MFKIFTQEELIELKYSLNEFISSRILYLNSYISEREKKFTEEKLEEDYKLLKKILELIEEGKEE